MCRFIGVLCVICLLAGSAVANAQEMRQRASCHSTLATALTRGGFNGALPCGPQPQGRSVKLTKVGTADVLGAHYVVYRYVCKFKNGSASRNIQRVVIFRDGDYLGNYRLGAVTLASVKVKGSNVSIIAHDKGLFGGMAHGRSLTFDLRGGPPPNIWFAGQLSDFER